MSDVEWCVWWWVNLKLITGCKSSYVKIIDESELLLQASSWCIWTNLAYTFFLRVTTYGVMERINILYSSLCSIHVLLRKIFISMFYKFWTYWWKAPYCIQRVKYGVYELTASHCSEISLTLMKTLNLDIIWDSVILFITS